MILNTALTMVPVERHNKLLLRRKGPPRAIHFIDVENLALSPLPSEHEVRLLKHAYVACPHFEAGDLLVIACSHLAAPEVRFGWPEGKLVMRSGKDGADLALLDAMKSECLPERFTRVVIASGDGIFAEEVSNLARHGIDVAVVAPSGGLSRRLQMAATSHTTIDPTNLLLFPEIGEAA